ncbi:MAG: hypothetical protein J3T61_00200 [Candidatus Brocadiales bacterium]|nr:hypothetical protein [Candidatus Bathyanammoxibius sp.]
MSISHLNAKTNRRPSESAFGEAAVTQPTPIVQLQFPYSINTSLVESFTAGSGAASVANSLLTISTGATTASDSLLRSVSDAKYHSGQGALIRWTTIFQAAGTVGTEAVVGYGNEEDGFFFGYDGATFGVLHRSGGEVEHQTLTISAGAGTASGTITITLDGTATEVEVVQNDTVQSVARAIGAVTFAGWETQVIGDAVVFISHLAEAKAGSFTFADTDTTGTAASFAETITGVAPTDDWIAQTAWNQDVMNGSGTSRMTLRHDQGNVYQVKFQWLGFGAISFFVESDLTGEFVLVHRINYTNTNTATSLQNPTLPLYVAAKNGATTTDIVVKVGSMAAFTEGPIASTSVRHSTQGTATGDLTTETCILVLKNKPIYQSRANRVDYIPTSITFSANGAGAAKFTTLRLVHGPILGGNTSFVDINTATSIVSFDTASTTRTGGNIISTFEFGAAVEAFMLGPDDLESLMGEHHPGNVMAITVELDGGTSDVDVGISWQELF